MFEISYLLYVRARSARGGVEYIPLKILVPLQDNASIGVCDQGYLTAGPADVSPHELG
jgi:hypothetical protein